MHRILILLVLFCFPVLARTYHTTVTPLPGETLAGPCRFEMSLPGANKTVRGVFVVFDRGRDIMKFYSDPDVTAFARRNDFGLLMAHQCPAKNAPGGPEEMDMNPSHGVGRVLLSALDQFAKQSGHPEIKSAKLVLLGFLAPARCSLILSAGHQIESWRQSLRTQATTIRSAWTRCSCRNQLSAFLNLSLQVGPTRYPVHNVHTVILVPISSEVPLGLLLCRTELHIAASSTSSP